MFTRHMDRHTYGQTYIWTDRHMDRQTDIWTDRQDRQRRHDKQTRHDRQDKTDRQTDRQGYSYIYSSKLSLQGWGGGCVFTMKDISRE